MRSRISATLAVVLAFTAILLLSADPAKSAPAKPIELKIMHWQPTDNALHKDMFVPWAKMVEERTGGRVKCIIYPAELLGKAKDTYEAVINGTADIGLSHLGLNPGMFAVNQIYGLPFLYPNAPLGSRVMTEMFEKEPVLRAEFRDVKLLWFMSSSILRLHSTNKPIRTLEDLKGMKIRTGGGPQAATLKALGAVPVAISPPDVYTALERGTVDGLTFPWEAVKSFKVEEVTKYHNSAALWGGPFYVVMNQKKWDSLPPDIQKIMNGLIGPWASEFGSTVWEKDDVAAKEAIMSLKGHQIIDFTPEETARWKKAVRPIWDEWIASVEKKGLPGKKVLDEILQTVDKYARQK